VPDIKVKDVAKGTIKTIDKAAAAQRMKNAYIRTKDTAGHNMDFGENSPHEYAADRVSGGTDSAARGAVREFDRLGRKGLKTTKENISKAKEHLQKQALDRPKQQMQCKAMERIRQSTQHATKSIKTIDRSSRTIKQTAKSTAKGTVKTAQKTVKTAERRAKTAIKTTQRAAKAAAKTAQKAAQAARAAAKAAVTTAKAAAKAVVAAVKAIIAGTKALIAAIAAGGWIAVLIIIVICLVAMIVGSCFGIFFSNESSGGSGMTLQSVVQEINTDYQSQLNEIKESHAYDVLEVIDSKAVWQEVLAVYAVKTTSDPANAQEVATMDAAKKQILTGIFWEMNVISSSTATKTETVIEVSDDGHGNMVETEKTVTRTYLYITVAHKTVDEMADQYGFNEEQKAQLSEFLAEKSDSMWEPILGGVADSEG